jgi:hypothetical protein
MTRSRGLKLSADGPVLTCYGFAAGLRASSKRAVRIGPCAFILPLRSLPDPVVRASGHERLREMCCAMPFSSMIDEWLDLD